MAGLTDQGLTTKRQLEVIQDLKQQAVPIFQDLVPVGDTVDTSDSSTIGRLIGLFSLPIADLWEATQQVYSAFDPNSATGIALDNLVAYGGITRNPASPTTAIVVVWGDDTTTILAGNVVRAVDNTLYDTLTTVQLMLSGCNGFKCKVNAVTQGETYSLTIVSSNTTTTVSHVATNVDTATTILEALQSSLSGNTSLVTSVEQETLTVENASYLINMRVTGSNLIFTKVKSRVQVVNEDVGPKTQNAHEIVAIATPILGWDSVDNPEPAIPGTNIETDDELRNRFRNSKFLRAQNISDSLYSALNAIDGVRYVRIYENETGTYDATYDLNGHAFKPVVLGGNQTQIAQAIWVNKPLGIASEGNTSETILDSQGFQHIISFERPQPVDIYITVSLTTDSTFPADGADQIKSALIEYFQNNFNIGEDIIYSRLYTPINSIPGHQVDSLVIGTSASPSGTSNIPIAFNEIGSLSTANIVVNV